MVCTVSWEIKSIKKNKNKSKIYVHSTLSLAGRLINCRPLAGRLIHVGSIDRFLIAYFCVSLHCEQVMFM